MIMIDFIIYPNLFKNASRCRGPKRSNSFRVLSSNCEPFGFIFTASFSVCPFAFSDTPLFGNINYRLSRRRDKKEIPRATPSRAVKSSIFIQGSHLDAKRVQNSKAGQRQSITQIHLKAPLHSIAQKGS